MSRIDQIRDLIADERVAEIEDLWLAALADEPSNIDFFRRSARLLADAGQAETAAFLLELTDEQLCESRRWEDRLALLEASGLLFLDPAAVHSSALDSLRSLYADGPSFESLSERVGLFRAIEDTAKIWTKIHRLRSLMQFEVGSYVWMKDKGAGRVVEVNMELESFKLELNDLPPLRVGFAAAAKLMQPLSKSHIERRKLEDRSALLKLKQNDPGGLLLAVLESHDDALTAAQIRKALTGIIDEREWNRWWAEARKHPRVLTISAKGRQRYGWAASEDQALEEIRREFAESDLDSRLEILRKNATRDPDLLREMSSALRDVAQEALDVRPDQSMQIWYALDKIGEADALPWSASSIVRESIAPTTLALSLSDRSLRERFYALCLESRTDWSDIYCEALLGEKDPRLLAALAEPLGRLHPEQLKSVVDDILGHPRRHPAAFVWLAESGDSLATLTERNPLRMIRQILDAFHQTEFKIFRSRLHKTFETGGGAIHLFAKLSEEQASQAERAVHRSPLEEHVKESLVRYLHVRYPALDDNRQSPLYATQAAIDARRRELEKLKLEEIPANRRAIEEARELGDLRENFEYKAARQRHEYLNARVASLETDLSRVQPLSLAPSDLSEVRIGCRVSLADESAKGLVVTVLGPWESDPDRQIVSYDSDLGQDLLGKRTGDSVTLEGVEWVVKSIESYQI